MHQFTQSNTLLLLAEVGVALEAVERAATWQEAQLLLGDNLIQLSLALAGQAFRIHVRWLAVTAQLVRHLVSRR
jgi:hypothetical protein